MNVDLLLSEFFKRIKADPLFATALVVKGAKRPTGYTNPSVTVFVQTNRRHSVRARIPTIIVNCFVSNNPNGTANTSALAQMATKVESLFDEHPLAREGLKVWQVKLAETLGPLYDANDPNEHYMSTRFQVVCR